MSITIRRFAAATTLAVGAVLAAAAASAADGNGNSDNAGAGAIPCDGARQDRAACLREAGAARQERKTGGLTGTDAGQQDSNAVARCDAQPASARAECEARIRGTGSTSSEGSVLGGGVVRKTVTPTPAPAAR